MTSQSPSWVRLTVYCVGFLVLFFAPLVLLILAGKLVSFLPTTLIVFGVGLLIVLIVLYSPARPSEAEIRERFRRHIEKNLKFKYVGEYKDGKRDGQGTLLWQESTSFAQGEHSYQGNFKDNLFHGQGTLRWANGSEYKGSWTSGGRSGWGTMTWADGGKYEGYWLNDVAYGRGAMSWPDGSEYIGGWRGSRENKDGHSIFPWLIRTSVTSNSDELKKYWRRDGKGTMCWPNGRKYEGGWSDDYTCGQGVMTLPDGTRYEGDTGGKITIEFSTARGTITYANGDKFIGLWEVHKPRRGKMIWNDGRVYDGEFGAKEPNGEGTMWWPNGMKYHGMWSYGEYTRGTMWWPHGSEYVGSFINGKCDGFGCFTDPIGSKFDGIFKNGNYVGPVPKPSPVSANAATYVAKNNPALSVEKTERLRESMENLTRAMNRLNEIDWQNAGDGSNDSGSMGVAAKVVTGAAIGWGLGHIIFKQDSSK